MVSRGAAANTNGPLASPYWSAVYYSARYEGAIKNMNKRHLFIIARCVPLMYEELRQSFAGHADIEVIVDRRRRERRRQSISVGIDRRRRERRTVNIDALLRQLGWVVVKQRVNFEGSRNGIARQAANR